MSINADGKQNTGIGEIGIMAIKKWCYFGNRIDTVRIVITNNFNMRLLYAGTDYCQVIQHNSNGI